MFLKNSAVTGFMIGNFIAIADGSTVTTGTPTCKRLLDGTAAALTNAASYNADALAWEIDLAAADTNADMVGYSFTLADCLPISFTFRTTLNLVGTAQTGDAYARLGAPAGASVSADVAAVKSDSGAIKTKTDYLPSATAGAAGGVFIAGANAATSITTALTANITGNVSGSVGSVTGAVGSVTGAVGSVTGAVGSVTGAVGSIAANGITATSIATDAINAAAVKADAVTKIQNGLATPTNITAGTITTATNLTNLPATAALEATLTAMKGATFNGTTDSLEAIRDRGDAAWITATGFATPTNITAGTITTVTNLTNAPTNGDLTATMKTSVTTAATAATPIAASVTGAVGSVTGLTAADVGAIKTTIGVAGAGLTALATQASVNDLPTNAELATALGTADDAVLAILGTPVGASMSADIAAVKANATAAEAYGSLTYAAVTTMSTYVDTEVAAIKAKTDNLPAAPASTTNITAGTITAVTSVTNQVTANVTAISGDATAADRLEAILDATPTGTVVDDNDPDPTTLLFETNLTEATNDHYNGAFVVFYTGALTGQSRKISDYDGANKIVTVAVAFTEAPAAGDLFMVLGRSE